MNIVQEQKGSLEAVIKIQLTKEDYEDQVLKELKTMQRKAQMPGFRPGKVPFGMIKKMYGKSVLVEEVNKVLADALYNYIKEQQLNILGHPVADSKQADLVDWDAIDGTSFDYHIGLSPTIDLELGPDIQVDYHVIKVDDSTLNTYVTDVRRKYGKMSNPDSASMGDVLYGQFVEMDTEDQPKPEGHTHQSSLYVDFVKDEELKKRLVGIKVGDSLVFDVLKAVESEAEAASMLGVKKEELGNYNPLFRFSIDSINRVDPADLNEELFNKVAPGKGIQTEDAFLEFMREQIGQQYQSEVDQHFRNEVKKKLISLTALELPESFLKTWLLETNKNEITQDQVEKEFDGLADTFRWQLIENHLIKTHHLEVTRQDIHDHLEAYFRAQMMQYGQEDVEQEVIEGFIQNIFGKEEEIKKVSDHLMEQKLLALYKENLSLNHVELTFEEFVQLVTKTYKSNEEPEATSPKADQPGDE